MSEKKPESTGRTLIVFGIFLIAVSSVPLFLRLVEGSAPAGSPTILSFVGVPIGVILLIVGLFMKARRP